MKKNTKKYQKYIEEENIIINYPKLHLMLNNNIWVSIFLIV